MPLTKLQFRPGINKETTSFANEGGWFDCDKVRFRFGTPEKIGGWIKRSGSSFLGTARALHAWVAIDGTQFLGVGTHLKYYIEEGGGYNDATPLRETTASGGATFSATNGSAVITVTDSNHGAVAGDFVTFSGAATLGGNITADILNQEYQIDEIVSTTQYKFSARTVSTIASITDDNQLNPTAVLANSSDSGNGGSSVVAAYQVNVGLDTTVSGNGWGAGTWGRGTWGSGTSLTATGATLRIWSHE
jgi:Beta barrel domain of bacteriophage endosialidase.